MANNSFLMANSSLLTPHLLQSRRVPNTNPPPSILFQSLGEFSDGGGSSSPDSGEQQRISLWQHFGVLFTPTIQRTVEFAKKIPGFNDLTQDDQLLLLKKGMFEVWTVQAARNSNEATLVFSDGSYITRQQMEIVYEVGDKSEFILIDF